MLTDEAIPVTAFYFNNALFEYVRAPFGHVCAMNAFCCLMALLCSGYGPSSYYADEETKKIDEYYRQVLNHTALLIVSHSCLLTIATFLLCNALGTNRLENVSNLIRKWNISSCLSFNKINRFVNLQ